MIGLGTVINVAGIVAGAIVVGGGAAGLSALTGQGNQPPAEEAAPPAPGQGSMLDALIGGKKFQESLRAAVLEVLRSPEGQELLAKAIRRELANRK